MSAFLGNGQQPRVFWYQDFRNQTESRIYVYMWTDGHMWELSAQFLLALVLVIPDDITKTSVRAQSLMVKDTMVF